MPTLAIETDQIQATILEILTDHRGPEDRIKRLTLRLELSTRLGARISDRTMRKALEDLRTGDRRGAWICSDTEAGGGYFLARSLPELEAFLDADEARLATLARRIRAQRKQAGLAESRQLAFGL